MDHHRGSFDADDLVRVPPPHRPVVLKSGGPVMEVEAEEGENVVVRWGDDRTERRLFPKACLYRCVPFE